MRQLKSIISSKKNVRIIRVSLFIIKRSSIGGFGQQRYPPRDQERGYKYGKNRDKGDFRGGKKGKDNFDTHSKRKEDDTVSTDSLPGFGKSGPKLFFNKKRSEVDTKSLKDVSSSNPVEDRNIPAPNTAGVEPKLEPITETKANAKTETTEPAGKEEGSKVNDVELKRRDTDKEFEVSNFKSDKSMTKKDSGVLVNKVDSKAAEQDLHEDNKDQKSQKSGSTPLNPRQPVRGAARGATRGQRRPYGNRFRDMKEIEKHIDPSNLSRSTVGPSHKDNPPLIGDRPETTKNDELARRGGLGQSAMSRGGYNSRGRGNQR